MKQEQLQCAWLRFLIHSKVQYVGLMCVLFIFRCRPLLVGRWPAYLPSIDQDTKLNQEISDQDVTVTPSHYIILRQRWCCINQTYFDIRWRNCCIWPIWLLLYFIINILMYSEHLKKNFAHTHPNSQSIGDVLEVVPLCFNKILTWWA
jgi:hypothetical protein